MRSSTVYYAHFRLLLPAASLPVTMYNTNARSLYCDMPVFVACIIIYFVPCVCCLGSLTFSPLPIDYLFTFPTILSLFFSATFSFHVAKLILKYTTEHSRLDILGFLNNAVQQLLV